MEVRRQVIFKCRRGAATILGGVGWGLDSCPHQKRMRMGTLLIDQGGFFNDRNHATISALRSGYMPVQFFVLLERRFVFFCATTAVCKLSFGSTSCRGHGVIHFEIMVVSSYIARSCFGLSPCLEVPVGSCFFQMSGYTYKTEVHALLGMNKHGGFGGPLCAELYGDEVQSIVKRLLADSDNDKSMAFNNFTDSRPVLTKKQLQTMMGFDYADKKKLPFGPLPWPTGLPAPGYVPETNPLKGVG